MSVSEGCESLLRWCHGVYRMWLLCGSCCRVGCWLVVVWVKELFAACKLGQFWLGGRWLRQHVVWWQVSVVRWRLLPCTGIWSLPFFEKCTPKCTLFTLVPITGLKCRYIVLIYAIWEQIFKYFDGLDTRNSLWFWTTLTNSLLKELKILNKVVSFLLLSFRSLFIRRCLSIKVFFITFPTIIFPSFEAS